MRLTTNKHDKIKLLFEVWPLHTIATASWLRTKRFSYENLSGYQKSGWISRVGAGAFKRVTDTVSWEGAVFGLQNQYPHQFHLGGRTALELLGAAHFVPFGKSRLFLFTSHKKMLPLWFSDFLKVAEKPCDYLQYSFLKPQLGLTTFNCGEFQINISTRERAALEVAELLGRSHRFEECRLLFENLGTLRPKLVQDLLENCRSVKAKRVFLFLCKNLGHKWFQDLDLTRIDLGSGPRDVTPGGAYDSEFKITYPKGFFDDDQLEI